jgi:hypothetical protein
VTSDRWEYIYSPLVKVSEEADMHSMVEIPFKK